MVERPTPKPTIAGILRSVGGISGERSSSDILGKHTSQSDHGTTKETANGLIPGVVLSTQVRSGASGELVDGAHGSCHNQPLFNRPREHSN